MLPEISRHFGTDQPPELFRCLAGNPSLLNATWQHYAAVMLDGELKTETKDLLGLAVAAAKSNAYLLDLQRHRLRQTGMGADAQLEALAVAGFFEGFDGFAQALRVDSDLRPRKLAAGDMSLIDREVDVNVPYIIETEDSTVQMVFDEIKSRMGIPFVPNIFKALAHRPEILQAKWESYKAVMLGGQLRRLTKELIAIAVSAVNGCFY